MRAFIAIDLPNEVRAALADAQNALRKTRVKVSWARPENIHLTLKFLGEITDEQRVAIESALASLTVHHRPFTLSVAGAGGFPSLKSPRVIWIGCNEPTGALPKLQAEVETAAEALGFPREDRAFTAHLTLGRVKFPKPDPALTSAVELLKNKSFGEVRVSEVHLIQSQLRPEGPIYTKLSSHPLRAAG
jgi:2'-5' RNA ligase